MEKLMQTILECISGVETPVKPFRLPDCFEVNVTSEDIQLGWRGSETNCPIAKATRRYLVLELNTYDSVSIKANAVINGMNYNMRRSDVLSMCIYDLTRIMRPRTVKFTKTY